MRYGLGATVAVVGLLYAPLTLAQAVEPRRSDANQIKAYKVARVSYDKAVKAFEKRELEKTVSELEMCLKRMPEYSDAHFLLAKVRYLEKDFPQALEHMENAKASFDQSNRIYFEAQGDRWRELERLRDRQDIKLTQLQDAYRAATTDQQRQVIQNQISQAEHDRDQIQRQLYEPPSEQAHMPTDYYFFHGNILLRMNRLDDAAVQYREALKLQPDHADASNNLASLYYGAGHPQVALDILKQAEANGATVNPELKKAVLEALQH